MLTLGFKMKYRQQTGEDFVLCMCMFCTKNRYPYLHAFQTVETFVGRFVTDLDISGLKLDEIIQENFCYIHFWNTHQFCYILKSDISTPS